MIQAKNLKKIYKPKSGQQVAALNDVTLTLPDRGMVFILGKSGSGKSTLLNLLGGLDRPTSGEIIVNGENILKSKNRRLDSYRNTYVGFIFQEYNLLPEFTVGANIALAIELQGRRASNGEISAILHEVDLDGYGARRINELSGGQLQRVAIARALVKKPDIIMADEPTGALDSATGKAVFDTLKKLSSEKLVLVVSHDRDFSERYADRIISLADGNIVGDDELAPAEENTAPKPEYGDDGVTVPAGYVLTEEDLNMINDYLRRMEDGSYRLSPASTGRKFRPTQQTDASPEKEFKLIKSRLPLSKAARIGGHSMRIKPFRLVMTVLLSVVAFTLFGLSFAMSSYDKINSGTVSIADADIGYAAFTKEKFFADADPGYWSEMAGAVTSADIANLYTLTGIELTGVYNDGSSYYISSLGNLDLDGRNGYYFSRYTNYITGFCGLTEEQIGQMGYDFVCGRYPESDGEIAIPLYVAESFLSCGYTDGKSEAVKPDNAEWLIGKTIALRGSEVSHTFRICGVVDTKFDSDRYKKLTEDQSELTEKDQIEMFIRALQLNYAQSYSLCSVGFCRPEFVAECFGSSGTQRRVEGYVYMYSEKAGAELMRIDRRAALKNGDWIKIREDGDGCVVDIGMLLCFTGNGDLSIMGEQWAEIMKFVGSIPKDELQSLVSNLVAELEKSGERNIFNENYTVDIYDGSVGEIRTINTKIDGVALSLGNTVYFNDGEYYAIPSTESGYAFAVGVMPSSRSAVRKLLEMTYSESGEYRYSLKNEVTEIIGDLDDIFISLSSVFIPVGIVFAIFASLLFSNFIAQSILHKKMQIGILRAIGARSVDVFSIFFSESFFIAMINFVISFVSTMLIASAVSSTIRDKYGFAVTVLPVGASTALVLFLISIAAAFIASFLPVWRIARKKPVDAIRNR